MKKGFTLIELLAVIVILAIIALIAAPIVLNIIKESKTNATLRSVDNYLHALELKIANKELIKEKYEDGVYSIDEFEIKAKGEKIKNGFVQIVNGEIKKYSLSINDMQIDSIEKSDSKEEYDLWDGISISEMTPDANGDYHITKASELAWLARETNAGTTFEGVNFYLENSLDLNNKDWTPIGTSTNKFKGNFYGNIHVIKNMYINNEASKLQGLFGDITGIVDGLIIKDSTVIAQKTSAILSGVSRVGASISNITIYNSKVKLIDNVAGGVVGQFQGKGSNLKIINSNIEGATAVGGIIGKTSSSITDKKELSKCYLDANTLIYAFGKYESAVGYAYGLVGGIAGTGQLLSIDNCITYATVESLASHVGGGAGQLLDESTIENTKIYSNIKGKKITGGIVGVISGNSSMIDCEFFGNVRAEETEMLGSLAGASQNSAKLTNNIVFGNLNDSKATLDNLIGNCASDTILQDNIIK